MNVTEIVKNRFLKNFYNKEKGNIGVELEFPLLNMNKKPVDEDVCNGLLQYFLNNGFEVEDTTTDKKPAFIVNNYSDVLSFDNSYNNFEFSMNYGDNLLEIKNRFEQYLKQAESYLKPYNHIIAGLGTNPYKRYITQSHVSYPVYNMVDEFLHNYSEDTHNIPDFPSYLSSVQTHLDVNIKDLPKAYNLFSKASYIRAMLFGNSIGLNGEKVLCYRDYLWEKSGFGKVNNITGKNDKEFHNEYDIINDFLNRGFFNRIRNGKYEIINPTSVKEYFSSFDAKDEDIKCFLSFRDVEITARGTLEIRGDCAQPLYDAFLPPAFNLGLLYNMDKALSVLIGDKSNTELRNKVINIEYEDFEKAKELCDIAYEGLKKRNKGEEEVLKPVFKRIENRACPAKNTIKMLESGSTIEDIILNNC